MHGLGQGQKDLVKMFGFGHGGEQLVAKFFEIPPDFPLGMGVKPQFERLEPIQKISGDADLGFDRVGQKEPGIFIERFAFGAALFH